MPVNQKGNNPVNCRWIAGGFLPVHPQSTFGFGKHMGLTGGHRNRLPERSSIEPHWAAYDRIDRPCNDAESKCGRWQRFDGRGEHDRVARYPQALFHGVEPFDPPPVDCRADVSCDRNRIDGYRRPDCAGSGPPAFRRCQDVDQRCRQLAGQHDRQVTMVLDQNVGR
jgi:hypothetical protein